MRGPYRWMLVAGAVVALLVAGSAAGAAVLLADDDAPEVFHACARPNGSIRVGSIRVDDEPACTPTETPVSWNATGPPGPPGGDANGTLVGSLQIRVVADGCPAGEYRAVVEVVSDDPPAFEDSGCSGLSQLGFAPVWSGDPFIPNEALDEVTGVWIPGRDPHGGWVETPYGPFRLNCYIIEATSPATGVFGTNPVRISCGAQITDTTPQAIADFESALGSGLVMSPPFVFYEMP